MKSSCNSTGTAAAQRGGATVTPDTGREDSVFQEQDCRSSRHITEEGPRVVILTPRSESGNIPRVLLRVRHWTGTNCPQTSRRAAPSASPVQRKSTWLSYMSRVTRPCSQFQVFPGNSFEPSIPVHLVFRYSPTGLGNFPLGAA